jgi:hypothetical protein
MTKVKQYYRNTIGSRLLGGKLRYEIRFWLGEAAFNIKWLLQELKFQLTNW